MLLFLCLQGFKGFFAFILCLILLSLFVGLFKLACFSLSYLIMYLYTFICFKCIRGLKKGFILDVVKCYYNAYMFFVGLRRF